MKRKPLKQSYKDRWRRETQQRIWTLVAEAELFRKIAADKQQDAENLAKALVAAK